MFYETKARLLDSELKELKKVYVDIQPYDKRIIFEDGVEIYITERAFLGREQIDESSYMSVKDKLYKVMKIKSWSDYMEMWLYECRQVVV